GATVLARKRGDVSQGIQTILPLHREIGCHRQPPGIGQTEPSRSWRSPRSGTPDDGRRKDLLASDHDTILVEALDRRLRPDLDAKPLQALLRVARQFLGKGGEQSR